jgi:hypothetical protein
VIVCQLFTAGRHFFPGSPVFPPIKLTATIELKMLLKVALNIITPSQTLQQRDDINVAILNFPHLDTN